MKNRLSSTYTDELLIEFSQSLQHPSFADPDEELSLLVHVVEVVTEPLWRSGSLLPVHPCLIGLERSAGPVFEIEVHLASGMRCVDYGGRTSYALTIHDVSG